MNKELLLATIILTAIMVFLVHQGTNELEKSYTEMLKQEQIKKDKFMQSCLQDHKQYECDTLYRD